MTLGQLQEHARYAKALEEALTREVLVKLQRYAQRRAQFLAVSGMHVGADFGKHLATDAITDTAEGRRRWDPKKCPNLATHLCGVVRSRSNILVERHRSFPHVSIDGRRDQDGANPIETAASLATTPSTSNPQAAAVMEDLASRISDALYEAAAAKGDDVVRHILDAYSEGVTGKRHVVKESGISAKEYDAARHRLATLVANLPQELRQNAADVLGGGSR